MVYGDYQTAGRGAKTRISPAVISGGPSTTSARLSFTQSAAASSDRSASSWFSNTLMLATTPSPASIASRHAGVRVAAPTYVLLPLLTVGFKASDRMNNPLRVRS